MSSKKLLKDPQTCVRDMLEGLKCAYPSLVVNSALGLSFLNEDRGNKVALFSGGGSGHEPFAAGYIASNMLTGAVSGLVFTSPPVSNILSGINFLAPLNKGGVLVIIMNYTGDQLNFGLAIEHAKSKGIKVEYISINDDCALLGHESLAVIGKRGICGCAFVFKILGAMSDSGEPLDKIVHEYSELEDRLASMGACLEPCTLPNSDRPLFGLGPQQVSLGCGVHGEAGIATIEMGTLTSLVQTVLTKMYQTNLWKYGKNLCVLIGNLGSSTQMECLIVAKEVKEQLNEKGYTVDRLYVGTLMSSLDMRGFQISILNITDKAEWLSYLDSPTEAFGWPGTQLSFCMSTPEPNVSSVQYMDNQQYGGLELNAEEAMTFKNCVLRACEALKANEEVINNLDRECGDGDCGSTLCSLADGILQKRDELPWNNVGQTLGNFSHIAESQMGGTSGAVYSLLFQGAAQSAISWQSAWTASLETLYKYSPARVGHRTLIDALAPACNAYCSQIQEKGNKNWREALQAALHMAQDGCATTSTLKPKVGRACYAESSRVTSQDAGAFGVTVWLGAIVNSLI